MLTAVWGLILCLVVAYALFQAAIYPDRNKFTRFIMFWYSRPGAFGLRMDPRRQAIAAGIISLLIGVLSFIGYFLGFSRSLENSTSGNYSFFVLIGVFILAAFVFARDTGNPTEVEFSANETRLYRKYGLILVLVSVLAGVFLLYWTLATP